MTRQIEVLRAQIVALKLSNPYDASIPKLNQKLDNLIHHVQPKPTS